MIESKFFSPVPPGADRRQTRRQNQDRAEVGVEQQEKTKNGVSKSAPPAAHFPPAPSCRCSIPIDRRAVSRQLFENRLCNITVFAIGGGKRQSASADAGNPRIEQGHPPKPDHTHRQFSRFRPTTSTGADGPEIVAGLFLCAVRNGRRGQTTVRTEPFPQHQRLPPGRAEIQNRMHAAKIRKRGAGKSRILQVDQTMFQRVHSNSKAGSRPQKNGITGKPGSSRAASAPGS